MKDNKTDNIESFNKYNKISDEELVDSIFKTYEKISEGLSIKDLSVEDIKNIENFYSFVSLEAAIGMFNENVKSLAYEEMNSFVGNYSIYSNEMKKTFLNKYMEMLEYEKTLKTHEEVEQVTSRTA